MARPGYYIVKPGDTLIRIALDHGQNYRDIAAWSGLGTQPDRGGAGAHPPAWSPARWRGRSTPTPASKVRPVTPVASAPAAASTSSDSLRRRSRGGGKVPYSEQAWAQAQKPEAAPVVVAKVDRSRKRNPRSNPETRPRRSREKADTGRTRKR